MNSIDRSLDNIARDGSILDGVYEDEARQFRRQQREQRILRNINTARVDWRLENIRLLEQHLVSGEMAPEDEARARRTIRELQGLAVTLDTL